MAKQTQMQEVTTKDPKKVEASRRLAEWNRRKRKKNVQLTKAQSKSNITYYDAGAVVTTVVLGLLIITFTNPRLQFTGSKKLQPINFEMDKAIKWIRRV